MIILPRRHLLSIREMSQYFICQHLQPVIREAFLQQIIQKSSIIFSIQSFLLQPHWHSSSFFLLLPGHMSHDFAFLKVLLLQATYQLYKPHLWLSSVLFDGGGGELSCYPYFSIFTVLQAAACQQICWFRVGKSADPRPLCVAKLLHPYSKYYQLLCPTISTFQRPSTNDTPESDKTGVRQRCGATGDRSKLKHLDDCQNISQTRFHRARIRENVDSESVRIEMCLPFPWRGSQHVLKHIDIYGSLVWDFHNKLAEMPRKPNSYPALGRWRSLVPKIKVSKTEGTYNM